MIFQTHLKKIVFKLTNIQHDASTFHRTIQYLSSKHFNICLCFSRELANQHNSAFCSIGSIITNVKLCKVCIARRKQKKNEIMYNELYKSKDFEEKKKKVQFC